MALTLSPETEARLTDIAISHGMDPEEYLLSLLDEETLADAEAEQQMQIWWDNLTPEQRTIETEKTRQSLEAGDAGRTRPQSEVIARIRSGSNKIKMQ